MFKRTNKISPQKSFNNLDISFDINKIYYKLTDGNIENKIGLFCDDNYKDSLTNDYVYKEYRPILIPKLIPTQILIPVIFIVTTIQFSNI